MLEPTENGDKKKTKEEKKRRKMIETGQLAPRYVSDRESDLGSPEQRLGDALINQDRRTNDLLMLLNAMGSGEQERILPQMFSFNDSEDGERSGPSTDYSPSGRAYTRNGRVMYQPISKEDPTRYEGTGRTIRPSDLYDILGGQSNLSGKDEREVLSMLSDPSVMQFFMDVYGEAGDARRPNTLTLKPRMNTEFTTGEHGTNYGQKKPKADKSCKGDKCWKN